MVQLVYSLNTPTNMCIIIHKNAGKVFPRELYDECFTRHSDGVGLAYVKDGILVVDKGMFTFDEAYTKIKAEEHREMLIHFRNAPYNGNKNTELCHPFVVEVTDELGAPDEKPRFQFAITHNGSFLDYTPGKDTSDTKMFVDEILRPHLQHDPYFFDHLPGMYFLTRFCGVSNKMAIMRYDTEMDKTDVYIINPKQGEQYKGCWFSNDSFKKKVWTPYRYDDHLYASTHVNYSFKDQWEKADCQGWYWSFTHDMWVHKKSQARRNELVHRIHKPSEDMRTHVVPPFPEFEGFAIAPPVDEKKKQKELKKIAVDWFRKKSIKHFKIDNIDTVINLHRNFIRNSFPLKFTAASNNDVDDWIYSTVTSSPDSDAIAEAAAEEQARLIASE